MDVFSEDFQREHFLSRVDARLKLIVALSLLVMVLSYQGVMFQVLVAAISFMLCLKLRIPLRVLLLRMAQPLFIASVIVFLKLFFSGEDVLFSFHLIGFEASGYKDGLVDGVRISSRILGGVSIVIALGFATPFVEFMGALSWMRIPRPFIEIMMFAYRYVFVIFEDATTIYSAQKNRLGYSGISKGLRSFSTLTGSLVLKRFDQSQKTAEAMTQRGYSGDMPFFRGRPLKPFEIVLAVMIIVFMGSLWMV